MKRYFLSLAYNGTKYHGWQVQPNAHTVQAELNKALSVLLKAEIETIGAGRTDTGVHASYFVVHFEVENLAYTTNDLVYKLNRILPKDIAAFTCLEVDADLHARFSATNRSYQYTIHQHKNPFIQDTSFFFPHQLDVLLMNKACEILLSTTDFTSFSKLHTDVKTNNCKVTKAIWLKTGPELVFEISADRFLRNMVRAIVGTLLDIGLGKLSIADFEILIQSKDRGKAGTSAPACGLFLTAINYTKEIDLLLQPTNDLS